MNELFEVIYQHQILSLENRELDSDKKILVLLSGVPGSGKSSLARRLKESMGYVRIVNDDIRDIITPITEPSQLDEWYPDRLRRDQLRLLQNEYIVYLLRKLKDQPNGRIVLDRDMDAELLPLIQAWAKQYKYQIQLIALEISRNELINRIQSRQSSQMEQSLASLDFYIDRQSRFFGIARPNVLFKTDQLDIKEAAASIDAMD